MNDFKKLPPRAQTFIILVVVAGAIVIAHSTYQLFAQPIGFQWVILATLTLLAGSFNVKVTSINAYISVSEAFVFASILLFGTPAGTATVVLECMVISLWMKRELRLLHRTVFNIAAPAVAVWTSGTAFYLLSGIQPYSKAITPLPTLFLPLVAFTALFFLINSWLVAIAIGLEGGVPAKRIWAKNFAWLSVNYFSGASLAALIVTYSRDLEWSALAVLVPLLVVQYLTFRTAMDRAEDSYSHLAELNRLYLSTIETLAMAIDAKDQITHGHIRRVQTYAVGLAKRMGVADQRLLKAIEAAALLHDMGKLAVPEYILNKPGKLTPAEFEKMKLHASVGADILSAIDFPYPVVPIVRHHHENWDGTGYPTGLRGTDIPIGARILSVVDCFDALTSDRPYRAKLSDQAAIDILLSRRGNMYDPLVVDTFIRVHREIAPEAVPTVDQLTPQPVAQLATEPGGVVRQAPEELSSKSVGMQALGRSLAGLTDLDQIIGGHIRRAVPFSLAIVFAYDIEHDELVARHVIGNSNRRLDLRISLGERLSGWVAANRHTILNSDPGLDLAGVDEIGEGLKTTLSVPLMLDNTLVGVLALYSTNETFSDDDRRIVESSASAVAQALKQKGDKGASEDRDVLTGLPLTTNLPALLNRLAESFPNGGSVSLLFIDVVSLATINAKQGRTFGDKVLQQVARIAQDCLSTSDALFRHTDDEFVALLSGSDVPAAATLARTVREAVRTQGTRNGATELLVSTHTLSIDLNSPSLKGLFLGNEIENRHTTARQVH